ncbi:MAG: HlyD family type I secretion periplasmic adaptor subunit [Magnetococcales bacterium]|nr:HlyD family type I secretion periplasmic adaptor subunit [Magnetococcales bacterium]
MATPETRPPQTQEAQARQAQASAPIVAQRRSAPNAAGQPSPPPHREHTLAPGQFVFEEGEIGDYAYVLVSGSVEICKLGGSEYITLKKLEPGALFGEMALLDKTPRSASARVTTASVVREIDEQALKSHIRQSPAVAMDMMHRLASYVRDSNKSLGGSLFNGRNGDQSAPLPPPSDLEENKRHKSQAERELEDLLLEFQSPREALERRRYPMALIYTFGAILFMILSFTLWASLSVIDTTVSARGRLTTTVPTIPVQATDHAMVKEILVQEGVRVAKGEPMVILDETFAVADLAQAEVGFRQLTAKIQRLSAEMNRENLQSAANIDSEIERKVFRNRLQEYHARIAAFDLDLVNLEQQLTTSENNARLNWEQLSIQAQIAQARQQLFDEKVGSQLNLLQARNSYLSSLKSYHAHLDTAHQLTSRMESIRANRMAFISDWFSQIGQQLSESLKQRDAQKEGLVKLNRRMKNIRILAPADGVVMALEKTLFVGAIVSKGNTILSLVPSNVPLTAELDIDPRDIGNLMMGASVSIKLDALPFQKHGEMRGEVTFISEDTVAESTDGTPGTFYRARATIIENKLEKLPPNFRLVPGMLFTGDILAGRRRLITYFIYPVVRTINTSFTEPGQ